MSGTVTEKVVLDWMVRLVKCEPVSQPWLNFKFLLGFLS